MNVDLVSPFYLNYTSMCIIQNIGLNDFFHLSSCIIRSDIIATTKATIEVNDDLLIFIAIKLGVI